MVQDELAGITPPFNLMPKSPAINAVFRLFTSVPPQVLVVTSGVSTFIPGTGVVGKASIKVTALMGTAFGLTKLKVSTDGTRVATGFGLKLLVMEGATGLVTIKFCSVTLLVKLADILFILAVVLLRVPAAPTFTVKVIKQVAPAAMLKLVALKPVPLLAAVKVGAVKQPTLVGTGGLAMVSPVVKVSLNVTAVRLMVVAALLSTLKIIFAV